MVLVQDGWRFAVNGSLVIHLSAPHRTVENWPTVVKPATKSLYDLNQGFFFPSLQDDFAKFINKLQYFV